MAFVEALDSPGEVAGVITLGNIIQEILGSKIIDEFDLICKLKWVLSYL